MICDKATVGLSKKAAFTGLVVLLVISGYADWFGFICAGAQVPLFPASVPR